MKLKLYLGFAYFVSVSPVMGNASGRSEGEVTSGDEYKEEGYGQEGMEFVAHGGGADVGYHAQTAYAGAEPTVHSTPHGPRGYLQPPLIFTPQVFFCFNFFFFKYMVLTEKSFYLCV